MKRFNPLLTEHQVHAIKCIAPGGDTPEVLPPAPPPEKAFRSAPPHSAPERDASFSLSPRAADKASAKDKSHRALPAFTSVFAKVPDATLAYLAHCTADEARELRPNFLRWSAGQAHTDWRLAWNAYLLTIAGPKPFTPVVMPAATPPMPAPASAPKSEIGNPKSSIALWPLSQSNALSADRWRARLALRAT